MNPIDFMTARIEAQEAVNLLSDRGQLYAWGKIHILSPVQRSGVVLRFRSADPITLAALAADSGQLLEGGPYDQPEISGMTEQSYYLRRPIAMYAVMLRRDGPLPVYLSWRFEGEEESAPVLFAR